MAKILALDAASKIYGWAILDTSKREKEMIIAKGIMNFKEYQGEEKDNILLKIIYDEVKKIFTSYKIDYACIEDTYCKNVKTVSKLSEIRAVSSLAVFPLKLHKISTLKLKSDIGMNKDKNLKEKLLEIKNDEQLTKSQKDNLVRKAKKECVMKLVNKKFDLKIKVDDISDAIALAYSFYLTLS